MAKIMGFQLKNIKKTRGIEGYGCIATMYLDGKKIGTYADYADGAMGNAEYDSKEAEEKMTKVIISYAKKHPSEYVVKLYDQRPKQFKETCQRFKEVHPYIPDEDITKETMSANDICFIVEDFLLLHDAERRFKTMNKKGYKALFVSEKGEMISYPSVWTDEKVLNDVKKCNLVGNVYFSIEDFEQ